MKLHELNEKIREAIIKCAPKKEEIELNDHVNLDVDFGYNSMGFIQLIVELENIFDIEIPDEYLNDKMYNYGFLKNVINSLVEIL